MPTLTKEVRAKGLAAIERYQNDPVAFMTQVLDVKPEHIWSKMRQVAESVRDNQFTAVPAGHDVSKTYTAARLAIWFKMMFQPSTVLTTAPNDNLVRTQLWREIHAAHSGAKIPLGGKMQTTFWDVKPKDLQSFAASERSGWEINFAIGFSTSPDEAGQNVTRIQGYHNKYVLIIIDEASGLHPLVWQTIMQSLIVNQRCKVLAIGNPTDPDSDFAKACKPGSGWNVVHISCLDTPNYISGEEIIPGIAGRDYVNRMHRTYGEDSNVWKYRVAGLFPDFHLGTIYGAELARAEKEGRIGDYPSDSTAKVHSFWDLGDVYTAAIFAQFIGSTIRVIDCYWDNAGCGLPAHAKVVHSKGYVYGEHFAGPDLITSNAKSGQTGMTTRDVAAQLGIGLRAVIPHRFDDGIEAVRGIWPLIRVNKSLGKVFLDATRGYRHKKNEALSSDDQPVYYKDPLDSWEKHMMDALRHLAMAYRYMSIDGRRIGSAYATETIENQSDQDYDPLAEYRGVRHG